MVAGIGDVKISMGVQRYAPRIVELARRTSRPANHFNRAPCRVEHMNAAVAELAYELLAISVHANIVRITEILPPRPGLARGAQKFSLRREDLNAMIARICDVKAIVTIDGYALRAVKLAINSAELADRAEKPMIVRRKALNPFRRAVFAYEDVPFGVHSYGSRQSQFAGVRSMSPPLCHQRAVRRKMIYA